MKTRNIEIRILTILCIIFWIFQSIPDEWHIPMTLIYGAIILPAPLLEKKTLRKYLPYIKACCAQFLSFGFMIWFKSMKNNQMIHIENVRITAVVFLIFLIVGIVPFYKSHKQSIHTKLQSIKMQSAIWLIMLMGYLLRQLQVYSTTVTQLQNDIGEFTDGSYGHLGYIYKIFKHSTLPTGDPTKQLQYYQPPLSHIVMGIWAKINSLFGMSEKVIAENLQVLSLFFSSMIIIVAYKIMKEITKNEKGILSGIILVAFFPYLLEYAGAVNNDLLSTLLGLSTILYMIRWYKHPNWKFIILCALSMGCSMMAKLSIVIIAPVMACVFIYKLIINRQNMLFYIKQYFVFALISIPLGIWFPVKNLILYQVPLNYVLKFPPEFGQHMGGLYTTSQRLFEITWAQLQPLYVPFEKTYPNFTYNIGILFSKFCTFGETTYFVTTQWSKFIGTLMYLLILLIIMYAIGLVIVWIKKSSYGKVIKFLMAGSSGILLISYVKFCFDYPLVCTANIRYIIYSIVLIFCMMASGIGIVSQKQNSKNQFICYIYKNILFAYVCINTIGLLSMLYNI